MKRNAMLMPAITGITAARTTNHSIWTSFYRVGTGRRVSGRLPPFSGTRESADLLHFGQELRHGLEQVRDQAVVRDLEDRGIRVLVDCDDDLRACHASDVL